uniref:DUF4225 domain-containing protein n=1 Tax=Meloidogyne hapla TaxID=6305 RepID=A0A1I8B5F5_MELHA
MKNVHQLGKTSKIWIYILINLNISGIVMLMNFGAIRSFVDVECRDCINDKLVYNAAHHSLAIQDQADYIQKRLEEAENQIRKNAIDIALLQRRITKIEYDLKTAEEKAALKSACNMEFDKDNYVKHKEEEISSIVIDVVKYGGMFLTGLGCTVATVNPAVGAGCAAATGLAIEGIVKSGKLICEYVNEV